MTETTLERLLDVPGTSLERDGSVSLDCASYGYSSYYEKANFITLEEDFDGVKGFMQMYGYGGSYMTCIDPDLMSDDDAERLISLLENASMWCGYPVLNEQLAYDLEYEDTIEGLKEALRDYCSYNDLYIAEDLDVVIDAIFREGGNIELYKPEAGPYIYIDESKLEACIPEGALKKIQFA